MEKKQYLIRATILKGYLLEVEAFSEEEAINQVESLSSQEIQDQGSLKYIEVDYIEPDWSYRKGSWEQLQY